jgi:hypothetical protein
VDLVLSEITADECDEAAEELARYLDAGQQATRLQARAGTGGTSTERRWRQPGEGEADRDRAAQDLILDEPTTGTGATRGNATHLLVLLPSPGCA